MRIAALILGILGGLLCFLLGGKWVSDYSKNEKLISRLEAQVASMAKAGADVTKVQGQLDQLGSLKIAGYLLMLACPLGIAGGVLAKIRDPRQGAIVLGVAAVLPVLFSLKALLTCFFLGLAALLAALAKPAPVPAPVAAPVADAA